MQGNKQVTRAAIEFYGPDRAKWLGAPFPFTCLCAMKLTLSHAPCLLHHPDTIWICSQAELHEHCKPIDACILPNLTCYYRICRPPVGGLHPRLPER